MFTVLVVKPDKTEVLYSCEELSKEPFAIIMRGPNLGGAMGMEILGPKGQTMAFDWDRKGNRNEVQEWATIYVMNDHGKTVATYNL